MGAVPGRSTRSLGIMKGSSRFILVGAISLTAGLFLVPVTRFGGGLVGILVVASGAAMATYFIWARGPRTVNALLALLGVAAGSVLVAAIPSFIVFCNLLRIECS